MPEIPSFFFSHARQDRETPGNYLRAFFDDLEITLAQWAGVSLQEQRLGTIDARILQGDNWDESLSRSLANDNTFIAILTPVYFNRPSCGKELSVFLLRSPDLGVDQSGSLRGVRNVMLIRWLPEGAYSSTTGKDTLIPQILRLIQDTPADEGRDDPERTKAIDRYLRKGMARCVHSEPHYGELLNLFVAQIRSLSKLPPATEASFEAAPDAFKHDWLSHFKGATVAASAMPLPPTAPMAPRPLASVVAFYVTRRPFAHDPIVVEFADQLVAETPSAPADPAIGALLGDVRMAGVAEGLTVFHAAADPAVPAAPELLLDRLASLSKSRVLTALVVDPAVWPGRPADGGAAVIEQIIRSDRWTGPVLLPCLDKDSINVEELMERGLPPRFVVLPLESAARVDALRRAFVNSRGRVLRMSTEQAPDAERLPVLKNVGTERG